MHLLANQVKVRMVDENIARLKKCIADLSIEELNFTCNDHTLSIAQTVVHLNGNVRQWLFHHLLSIPSKRERALEFEFVCSDKDNLLTVLTDLANDICIRENDIANLNGENKIVIQGMQNTVVSALVHIIEHFSYHTGQAALITKIIKQKDLGFYANHTNLEG